MMVQTAWEIFQAAFLLSGATSVTALAAALVIGAVRVVRGDDDEQ